MAYYGTRQKNRHTGLTAGVVILTVLAVVIGAVIFVNSRRRLHDTAYTFDNCLYYEGLSDDEREIYRMFYDLVMHRNDTAYFRFIAMDRFEYAAHGDDLIPIYDAMLLDHPEFFFLEGATGRDLDIRGLGTNFATVLIFHLGAGDPDEDRMIADFEKAADDFLLGVDLDETDDKIEMQIHDRLIDSVTYDYELLDKELWEGDLGHTAYGALVADSDGRRHRAVCDGYAKAFQYLLGRAGICAAVVSGEADSESGTLFEQGAHAWNIVRLDGEWYEVDSCWDDIDPPPGEDDDVFYKIIKFEQPQYYNATHHWFNRTTAQMKQLAGDPNATIRVQQGSMFYEIDHCRRSTHVRKSSAGEDAHRYEFLERLLPVANGTAYDIH